MYRKEASVMFQPEAIFLDGDGVILDSLAFNRPVPI